MLIDSQGILAGTYTSGTWAGQLVTATGNTPTTNSIDTSPSDSNVAHDFGAVGNVPEVVFSILNSLTSAGAATVRFELVYADNAALTTNVEVVAKTDDFAYTALTVGTRVAMKWPSVAPQARKRYFGGRIVIGTAVLTNATGQFLVMLAFDNPTAYRDTQSGFTVA